MAGHATTAPLARRGDWLAQLGAAVPGCSASEREALARSWRTAALGEHASVAAFARFVLDLLALGAPPELLIAAQHALAEEVTHARLCFALAARYGDEPHGPGPLAPGGEPTSRDAVDIACSAVIEGCVGETVSATEVAIARDATSDPVVRGVFARIAEDEQRHAALAWRFVRWALAQWPELRDPVARAFATALASPIVPDDGAPDLREHGRLGGRERAAIARAVRDEVIAPSASSLLAARTAASDASDASDGRDLLAPVR